MVRFCSGPGPRVVRNARVSQNPLFSGDATLDFGQPGAKIQRCNSGFRRCNSGIRRCNSGFCAFFAEFCAFFCWSGRSPVTSISALSKLPGGASIKRRSPTSDTLGRGLRKAQNVGQGWDGNTDKDGNGNWKSRNENEDYRGWVTPIQNQSLGSGTRTAERTEGGPRMGRKHGLRREREQGLEPRRERRPKRVGDTKLKPKSRVGDADCGRHRT